MDSTKLVNRIHNCCYCNYAKIGFDRNNNGRLFCLYDLDNPVSVTNVERCPIEREVDPYRK